VSKKKKIPIARDRMGRFIDEQFTKIGAMPPSNPWTITLATEMERRRLQVLADRNARLEKTQECWETCNCKKK
jgi:hypothetical protein